MAKHTQVLLLLWSILLISPCSLGGPTTILEDLQSKLNAFQRTLEEDIAEIWTVLEAYEEDIDKNTVDIVNLRMDQGEAHDEVILLTSEVVANAAAQAVVNAQQAATNAEQEVTNEQIIAKHAADIRRQDGEVKALAADVEEFEDEISAFIEVSFPPLGTILPWTSKPTKNTTNHIAKIPAGWQLCDGRAIARGPWKGQATPNINGNEYFLRGSSSSSKVLDVEGDTFQDHQHVDNGHVHTINPHSHQPPAANSYFYVDTKNTKNYDGSLDGDGDTKGLLVKEYTSTADATATMKSATAGIGLAKDTYRKGTETRPKNMRVQYIMRVE